MESSYKQLYCLVSVVSKELLSLLVSTFAGEEVVATTPPTPFDLRLSFALSILH